MGREGQTKDLRREDIEFGAALNESAIVSRMPKGQFMKMDNWRLTKFGDGIEKRDGIGEAHAADPKSGLTTTG